MSFLGIIATLRKLRSFLSSMFPGLERLWSPISSAVSKATSHPVIQNMWGRWMGSRWGEVAGRIFRGFYWSDYSQGALDPSRLPPAAVAILRPAFGMTAALCLLLPLAMEFPRPDLPAEIVEGAKGPVAVWSVLLWLICLALAWSCLLAGTALANRIALPVAAIIFLYFMGGSATGLPRSAWNSLVPLAALSAAGMGEFNLRRPGSRDLAAGLASCLSIGLPSGIALVALTPLAKLFPGRVLIFGLLLGIPLGLLAFAGGRVLSAGLGSGYDHRDRFPAHKCAALLGTISLVFFGTLVARGGLAVPANGTLRFLTLWTGYLWPLYYFIGIGVIYGLLGQSRVLTLTIKELVPQKLFIAATVLLLLVAAVFAWSPLVLDTMTLPWPGWILKTATACYKFAAPRIWANPIQATTWEWMRWVLLFDVGAVAWLLARRRLSAGTTSSLLFGTILVWSLIVEYMFQFSGFARTGRHSALVLFTFSVLVLWMVHKTGMQFSSHSSRHWPQLSRFGVYGGILLLVLLSLHARAAIHDTRVMEEVFLYFFSGLIGVGLPYFLYVYANRSLQRLPLPVHQLFGAFCAGAGLTIPLIALDKLVAAGGSLEVLLKTLAEQRERLLSSGLIPVGGPALPPLWIAARGAVVLGIGSLFAVAARRRLLNRQHGRAAMIFLLVAAALGFASFSKIKMDLPLMPLQLSLLITPFHQSITLDMHFVALYLAYGIPASILGLTIARPGRVGTFRFAGAAALAYALHLAVALAWPNQEAWLRSTGLLATASVAGGFLFFLLIFAARARVEEVVGLPTTETGAASAPDPGLRHARQTMAVLAGAALVILIVAALFQAYQGRTLPRPVPGIQRPVPVPAAWVPAGNSTSTTGAAFTRSSFYPRAPTLFIDLKSDLDGRPKEILEDFVSGAAGALPNFSARPCEVWNKRIDGTMALDFSFDQNLPGNVSITLVGTKALLPLPDHRLVVLTLVGVFDDWLQQRWDLVRIAESMMHLLP